MAVIKIGDNAGSYDIDVSSTGLDTLLDPDTKRVGLDLTEHLNGTATGSLTYATGKSGQLLEIEGTFYWDKRGDRSETVKEIHSAVLTAKDGDTLFEMTDFKVTGADLKGKTSFDDFINGQDYTIYGNDDANAITGAAGDDHLFGNGGDDKLFGGDGKDVLIGGKGDDTYYLSAGDKVTEDAKGGDDTIIAANNGDLSKFDNVEALVLAGKGDIDGVGNELSNVLTGNSGDNTLDGGKGADRMIGGEGDDTYIVDNNKDTVIETGSKDHDTIDATVSIDISKLSAIEDVFLFGKGDIDATGNKGDNLLHGNAGDNTLAGQKGDDELTGGKGSDHFVFAKGDGHDTITDFAAAGNDHDVLELDGFGKIKYSQIEFEKVGKDTYEVSLGHDSLTFEHVNLKDFNIHDFQF